MIALILTGAASAAPGVFVLGVDGMDPVILQRLIDEGKTPNLAKLASEGSFQPLGTVNPPQSPVAWSSFVTGLDPGGHGIFDFVHRDPKNYHPTSSATPPAGEPPRSITIFGYTLPLGSIDSPNNRGGTPFWDLLEAADVDVEIYRIPGNFPVPESEARVLSGMGTVDMRGGYGTYSLFTDSGPEAAAPSGAENAENAALQSLGYLDGGTDDHGNREMKGDIQRVTVQDWDLDGAPDTATGVLKGAPDVFHLAPGAIPQDEDYLTTRLTFHLDPEHETVAIEAGDEVVVLAEGEFSDWVTVTFDALPGGLMPLEGIVRFYAKELRPSFRVYASPVNLSPAASPLPVSSPPEWAEELSAALGPYFTQGMPEDTNALKDGTLDDDDYVRQVALVQHDTRAMLHLALSRFEAGDMTFVYLSDIDLQCHMLWRHGDPKYPGAPDHPAFEAESAAKHDRDIERFYRDVDQEVGRVREALPPETLLMVMSDHGFQPYTRKVHLNAWLRDMGYLVLKDGKQTGQFVSDDVDWSKTRAYGLGFNGLYLNRVGREAQGIVTEAEAPALEDALVRDLAALVDPETGAHAVKRTAKAREVFHGLRVSESPDLVVGYDAGYGCSDESTLGEIVAPVFEANTDKWSGNHLMAPEVVPGVLLVNRKLGSSGSDLMDLTATLLSEFGVAPAPGMTGEALQFVRPAPLVRELK